MYDELVRVQEQIDKINVELLSLIKKRESLIEDIKQSRDELSIDRIIPISKKDMADDVIMESSDSLDIEHKKELIISAEGNMKFQGIHTMFNIPSSCPIMIAGPCAVEDFETTKKVAHMLSKKGVKFLRGGAFKPRTSPYSFQGLKEDGLKILNQIGKEYNLITVTEVVDTRDVEMVSRYADVLQIGARNMQNYELLKEVGKGNHPVLVKRGMNARIREFMYAAEYIALQGNRKIILCERGIRTFESETRNTLDISCIPIIKKETNLPIIIDVSHSLGRKDIVKSISKAALAVGADGLMVEVHPYPELALSDNMQQLNFLEFEELLDELQISNSSCKNIECL